MSEERLLSYYSSRQNRWKRRQKSNGFKVVKIAQSGTVLHVHVTYSNELLDKIATSSCIRVVSELVQITF